MSFDQMQVAAKNADVGDCPSKSLHEEGGQGLTAWDDISGQQLEPKLMVDARKEEIKYFREIKYSRPGPHSVDRDGARRP